MVILTLKAIYALIFPEPNSNLILPLSSPTPSVIPTSDPDNYLYLKSLKDRNYLATPITIEQTLTPGSNYRRYIASYLSDGLKIYGLLTVPTSPPPSSGFPSIVFLHGYLDPVAYQTTARYVAYQHGFASQGFITFKPDLRGHGRSEGSPVNSNFSLEYVIDSLNLVSALKIYPSANPQLIGFWGHSNGGGITLRAMQVSADIRAAVIWGGVVGDYEDLLTRYRPQIPWLNNRRPPENSPDAFITKYGPPTGSSSFWSQVDPYSLIADIQTPVQLHHGTADDSVPVELSVHFRDTLNSLGKTVELFEYPGGDHNISSPHFSSAMKRSVEFFKKYLK